MTIHSLSTAALCTVIACALACLGPMPSASAQCQYEVTAIIQSPQCPTGGITPLQGRGLNRHGHVVGSYSKCLVAGSEAFYWTPKTGTVTMQRPTGANDASASDINDHGMIVGAHTLGSGWKAFVYDMRTQQYTYLEPLHEGVAATNISTLSAINNNGIAVGSRVISKPGEPLVSNAVIWNTNTGEVIDLGVGEGPSSIAADGNSSTDAGGWSGGSQISLNSRAVIWSNTVPINLGMLPGTIQSTVRAINIQQDAIGVCGEGLLGPYHPYLWTKGTMISFPIPDGYSSTGASDLNDVGQIVGSMRRVPDAPSEPFLLQHGQFHALNDLLFDDLPPHLTLSVPRRIGNDGKMIVPSTNGTRCVLLTPIGQPLGDLNHDCRVDVHDLQLLFNSWSSTAPTRGQTQSPIPADLNGDGVVNVSDLLILFANWSH